jgi:hypothetical protein
MLNSLCGALWLEFYSNYLAYFIQRELSDLNKEIISLLITYTSHAGFSFPWCQLTSEQFFYFGVCAVNCSSVKLRRLRFSHKQITSKHVENLGVLKLVRWTFSGFCRFYSECKTDHHAALDCTCITYIQTSWWTSLVGDCQPCTVRVFPLLKAARVCFCTSSRDVSIRWFLIRLVTVEFI